MNLKEKTTGRGVCPGRLRFPGGRGGGLCGRRSFRLFRRNDDTVFFRDLDGRRPENIFFQEKTVMGVYRFADVKAQIEPIHEEVRRQCRGYEADGPAELSYHTMKEG